MKDATEDEQRILIGEAREASAKAQRLMDETLARRII